MSGEGVISSFGEIRDRLRGRRPLFAGLFVPLIWHTARILGVIGVRTDEGHKIQLQLEGAENPAPLTFAEARQLAAEIVALADRLEHRVPD